MIGKLPVALAAFAAWLTIASAEAAVAVSTAPTSGRPTQQISVSGTSFGATEAVDVYFDTTDAVLLTTTTGGSFAGPLTLPSNASPGTHYVTAVGRHSGIAAQAAVTVTSNWTAYGFNASHTNDNAYENTVNTSNASNLGVLWTAKSAAPVLAAPVYSSGLVYTAGNAGVWAYVSTTGAKSWALHTTEFFYATPAVVGGVVYIGSASTSNFYAINATTGKNIWTYAMGATTRSSAAVVNGIVYVGCNDDKVYALNATTGALIWTYTTGGSVAASPAVYDGVVYVGSLDDKMYALDATTGALLWSFTTSGVIYGSAAIKNNVVFFGSYDDNLYALQAGSNGGLQLWEYTTGGAIYGTPAVANGIVYVGSDDDSVYAINVHSGAFRWSYNTGGEVDGTPTIANGVVYCGSDNGGAYMFDALYGSVVGYFTSAPYVIAPITVVNGTVYINGAYNRTYALVLNGGNDSEIKRAVPRPEPSSLQPNLKLPVTKSESVEFVIPED